MPRRTEPQRVGVRIQRLAVAHLGYARAMAPSALWLFAHRGLARYFHSDPQRFLAVLDGNGAPAFLEQTWAAALASAGASEPPRPPLAYGIDRPRAGLAIIWMRFRDVRTTGEPWHARFFVRDPDPGGANGYTRMFLLEHSDYATEVSRTPTAIVCESEPDGTHRNWGATFAPTDEAGFDDFVIATLRASGPRPPPN
jgi:hypothetical protein